MPYIRRPVGSMQTKPIWIFTRSRIINSTTCFKIILGILSVATITATIVGFLVTETILNFTSPSKQYSSQLQMLRYKINKIQQTIQSYPSLYSHQSSCCHKASLSACFFVELLYMFGNAPTGCLNASSLLLFCGCVYVRTTLCLHVAGYLCLDLQ